jgi:hypothetical protein
VTRYDWFPFLGIATIQDRLQRLIQPAASLDMLDIYQGIIQQAARRIPPVDIQYLEVTEKGNPRRSFDINIYKAGHRLMDLRSLLLRAFQHFSVPSDRVQSLFHRIQGERFGHLAGGVDRENRPFMTVYYGAKRIDGARLRAASVAPTTHA